MKSYQLSLNGFISPQASTTVSNAAYCKARMKFKHTAFIALNQTAVVDVMYGDDDYQTYHGFRILAGDGSKIRLPGTEENEQEFGSRPYANGRPGVTGTHPMALASVCYDVLNRVALDAQLLPVATHEVTAAMAQVQTIPLTTTDLIVQDRGYHSYRMLTALAATGAQFVVRAKRSSGMRVADDMLKGHGSADRTTTVHMPAHLKDQSDCQGLPETLTLRFVRVKLKDGTLEVLVTSVLDRTILSRADLKELYYMRWGIETFYGILKTRLGLENFSGYSVEAIRQDFHAAVLLTGIESILTMNAEEHLHKQTGGHPKKVNKAVSFNAIKDRAFELFMSDTAPTDTETEELTKMFLTSPTLVRKDRNPPRKRHPDNRVLDFYKRKRKITI